MDNATNRLERRAPLADRSISMAPLFEAAPAPAMRRWSLRARARDAARVGDAMGITLDVPILRSVKHDDVSVLRLSPDEWLLLCPENAPSTEHRFSVAPDGAPCIVDVTHRQTAVRLSGALCTRVLSAYCPLDLELQSFPEGACTRTVFGRSEILLWREAGAAFHLEVWRSYSDYVWRGLERAADDLRFEPDRKGSGDETYRQ